MKKGNILVVDENRNVLTALRILLENYFETVTLLHSPDQLLTIIQDMNPDIVLLDMYLSPVINDGNEGLYWLTEIKKQDEDLPVILFTAYADIDLAVKALKQGAGDFIVKPWDNARLIATLQSAYALRESRNEVKQLLGKQRVLQSELNRKPEICWGVSKAMQELQQLIQQSALTDTNILITGENGTGKEVIAREICRLSLRNKEGLITVDLDTITESLFKSELFGPVSGSMKDAKTDRTGKFEAANRGTLFLHDIEKLSYLMQTKILNVLQSKTISKIGDNKPIPVDIRLISATSRNLQESVRKGEFREDLLYRINPIIVEIPALRKRKEDIPLLVEFFIEKYARKYHKENISLSNEAINKLKEYYWLGNVRELQHIIENVIIHTETNVLQAGDFYLKPVVQAELDEPETLENAEKRLIQNSLKRNKDNLSAVATELGITRPTLYSKIKKYAIN